MRVTTYKKRDGTNRTSSTKVKFSDIATKYSSGGNITGHNIKIGGVTQFVDSNFQTKKVGIKLGNKTQYYNAKTGRLYK